VLACGRSVAGDGNHGTTAADAARTERKIALIRTTRGAACITLVTNHDTECPPRLLLLIYRATTTIFLRHFRITSISSGNFKAVKFIGCNSEVENAQNVKLPLKTVSIRITVVNREFVFNFLEQNRDLDYHKNLMNCFGGHAHPSKNFVKVHSEIFSNLAN